MTEISLQNHFFISNLHYSPLKNSFCKNDAYSLYIVTSIPLTCSFRQGFISTVTYCVCNIYTVYINISTSLHTVCEFLWIAFHWQQIENGLMRKGKITGLNSILIKSTDRTSANDCFQETEHKNGQWPGHVWKQNSDPQPATTSLGSQPAL